MQRCDGKAWFLLFCRRLKLHTILYGTGTAHDTVRYRYCIFYCSISLADWAKTSESLTVICTREREREREKVHYKCTMQCTVHFIITLFNVDNVRNLSIKLYRIYACYTNITSYDVIYSVRYYPRFSVTAVGLGTYYPRIRRSTCMWT
jgi:hypothetical protein